MLLFPKTDTIDNLIKLSKIFKEGFTIEIKNGVIYQYLDIHKPYIVSYKPLISLSPGYTKFESKNDIPKNCIVGGWHDKETNIYYIELNEAYANVLYALKMAKKYKQKAIYDYKRGVVINV